VYADIAWERRGQVVVLTLNRPDKLNAFSGQMGRELCDAYERCDNDPTVRAVVLTGAGRAFFAGADFSGGESVFAKPNATPEVATGGADPGAEATPPFRSDPFTFPAWKVRKPVLAAINGHAVGIGLTMTLHCDIRIIAEDAKCGFVQVRRGVMSDLRSHWALPRLVGHGRATELLLTGRMFSGADGAAWGLASESISADRVLEHTLELAGDIAANTSPLSVGVSKRLLWMDPLPNREEINDLERDLHLELMGAPDSREGVRAFMERRPPVWQSSVEEDWPDWLD